MQKHSLLVLAIIVLFLSFDSLFAAPAGDNGLGLRTVCIDAGHGGHDPGTISRDKLKTQEKALALSIAQNLRDKIKDAYPEIKVIMTRDDDTFIPLNDRADKANKGGADLFISIHIDAAENTSAKGHTVYVLGQSSDKNRDLFKNNMELTRRENSVILLEDDYSTTYEGYDPDDPESFIFFSLMQNAHLEQSLEFADEVNKAMAGGPIKNSRGVRQAPLLVLWKTTMPAVLIECGYISNKDDLAVLRSEKDRDEIADRIFRGFKVFKKDYDSSLNLAGSGSQEEAAAPAKEAVPSGTIYGTQVLVSGKKMSSGDRFFQGYEPLVKISGNYFKYFVGTSDSLEEARKENEKIKKIFKDSFLVKIDGNDIVRVQ